jgi:hypothetical protein
VVQRFLCGRRRDFGVAHATVVYGGFQALDGQVDVSAIRDRRCCPGVGQRYLGVLDQDWGMPHPTVVDGLHAG